MKDTLQRFVRDNKEDFDDIEPTTELWQKIEERIPKKISTKTTTIVIPKKIQQTNNQWFNWRIAATIVLVLGIGCTYYLNREYQVVEQPEVALSDLSSAKQMANYTRRIEEKRSELHLMINNDPVLQKEFGGELEQLEMSYQNLKAELPENPNQEIVIEAMIQNLQWQIDILNQQLTIIQKIKQLKNNEKNTQPLV
jgi:hypothetical protein